MDAGLLVPIFMDEGVPGDTFTLNMTAFGRLNTPIFPIMDNLYFDTFFFAVPNRLLWQNWTKFQGEQDNPGDSTDFVIPQVEINAVNNTIGSIFDYFGLPQTSQPYTVSALPFRAYQMIWRDWFRDQNLQDSPEIALGNGPDDPQKYFLLRRGKRHDYFTSCLPWPQKGPGVTVPLGGSAPVIGDGNPPHFHDIGGINYVSLLSGGSQQLQINPAAANGGTWQFGENGTGLNTGLVADLTSASAATINSLRQAFQIQKIFERDARGGTRYVEAIKARFGVTSPDFRQQRPEFLGGGSTPISISPIPQTSATGAYADSPQGTLAAMGTVSSHRNGFTYSCTEHVTIIGLAMIRADLTYQQGVDRMWSRKTRFDFYEPALSHLGEQAVLNKEIYVQGTAADDTVFGYQERFAEYRYKPSKISGLLRSSAPQSLDAWHLSQDFSSPPALNAEFIEENPPIDRVVAVPSEPHLILDMYFKMRCARPMPVYGEPGLIDHF